VPACWVLAFRRACSRLMRISETTSADYAMVTVPKRYGRGQQMEQERQQCDVFQK
jgi:hypothetical protein